MIAPRPLAGAALALLGLVLGAAPCAARPGEALTPPAAEAVVYDGVPDEAAWAQAAVLPFDPVEVPTLQGARKLTPQVRLLSAGGHLAVAVRMAEDPGTSMGLHLMVAPADARTAGEAVSIDYRPVEVRAPRLAVLGPRGAGRTRYRVDAGAVHREAGTWSLELGVPWRDLADSKAPRLRVALVVYTRTPNVVAAWPAGALWQGPGHWSELAPPTGALVEAPRVDAERLAREDAADRRRRAAWVRYQQGATRVLLPTRSREEVLAAFEERILAPLDDVVRHRPDLAVPVDCLRGDALHRLGLWQEAARHYGTAAAAAPGWREAHYGLHVKVTGPRRAEGDPGAPTDYEAALRDTAPFSALHPDSFEAAGLRLGHALLQYKRGAFDEALPVLTELAERYPFDAFLVSHAEFARKGRLAAAEERRRQERDAGKTLPRAEVETTRGTFEIELFPADAPNTVRNFVFLARAGFYDGLTVHRTVPFFLVQTGDPQTRAGAERAGIDGTGTPGYAIDSEVNTRRMLRGAVVMASAGKDTEGSQFYVLTGTALHLQGEQTVFGRVRAGLEVVDALRRGDRIVGVRLHDLDPDERYVPITVSGREPPAPVVKKPR